MTWKPVKPPPCPAIHQYASASSSGGACPECPECPEPDPCPVGPVNTVAPALTGTVAAGTTAGVTTGTWTGDATIVYTYRWHLNGVPIVGATSATYAIPSGTGDVGKTLSCVVTATNTTAYGDKLSNSVTIIAGVVTDPSFANVSLLMHGNSTFLDSSSKARTFTTTGSAAISSVQSKFGGASMLFNGGYAAGSTGTLADFQFGTGNFTVEFWMWRSSTKADALVVATGTDGSSNGGWWFNFQAGNAVFFVGGGVNVTRVGANSADSLWHHWAVARSGTAMRLFRDGTLVATTTTAVNITASNIHVGGTPFDGGFDVAFNGYVDDLRITKGVARYTANFTVPTAAFPDL